MEECLRRGRAQSGVDECLDEKGASSGVEECLRRGRAASGVEECLDEKRGKHRVELQQAPKLQHDTPRHTHRCIPSWSPRSGSRPCSEEFHFPTLPVKLCYKTRFLMLERGLSKRV